MKAKIKPRIDLTNRTKLETVIPLRTPYIINIDPSEACNFQCKFCPTGDRELMKNTPNRGHGLMDFELYKRIIDSCCEFEDKIKVIRLYKDGEPLMNPRFADMVKYAKNSGCCDRVDTTTNGALLTHALSDAIIASGLDRINISIEGVNREQYMEFSKWKLDFNDLVDNIRYLYEHKTNLEMLVKINGDILTEEQKQQFLDTFGDIADDIFIESFMDVWPTFEQRKITVNQERGIFGSRIEEVSVCPYVFYSFAITSDGVACACCIDWKHELVIGDATVQPIKEIWNSKELRDYQIMFLQNRRKEHSFCANCGQLKQGQPDNIDAFAEELLKKLEQR